jgi:hypothetical protein
LLLRWLALNYGVLTRRANCNATSPSPAGTYLSMLNSIISLFGTGSRKSMIASDV